MSSKISSTIYNHSEEEEMSIPLKTGIKLDELLQKKEAIFEVNINDDDTGPENFNYFNRRNRQDEAFEEEFPMGFSSDTEDDDPITDSLSPYEKLSLKMIDITDGQQLVYKTVKKVGTEEKIPKDATIMIHYTANAEYQDGPFDSTYLRDEPLKFRLNNGEVILGLDIAVKSMKLNEISYFLVKPEYAYGSMGCYPRIPPDATILYKVHLLNFVDDSRRVEYRHLSETERANLSFDKMSEFCRAEREHGNAFFKNKNYGRAKASYNRMKRMLEDFRLQNNDEERRQQEMLLICYLNLSICSLHLKQAPFVITMCSLALHIDPKNAKAYFRKGKAYKMLMEFDNARKCLYRAHAIEPNNKEINDEIQRLKRDIEQSTKLETKICQKMFSGLKINGSK